MREDRGRFAAVRGERVVIYWPHGLGDWVHLGGILPILESSNVYAITRFGDDYLSLMEGNPRVQVLFSGMHASGDGAERGARHLGVTLDRCNGGIVELNAPAPIGEELARFAPGVLLWTDYPETEGMTSYPFHTKARNLARLLVARERLTQFDLSRPLENSIDFAAPALAQRLVDERLSQIVKPGTRLCVIARTGITAPRKNWGDGSEARAFVAALRRDPPSWSFISMDDEDLGESVAGFRTLFGDIDQPFARRYKALAKRTDLFVGIPAGPLHLTLARGGVPTVGLWLSHHPDWYDEPNPDAIHLIGRYVRDRGFDRRPATTTKPLALAHRLRYLDTPGIGAEEVIEAARALIG